MNNYIETKKKELGLEHMTDNEILKYSLQCSQEIKNELSNQNNKVGNYKLIKVLSEADEVILNSIGESHERTKK
nr:MAG: hypothetical protein [Bacteriophage sp.]